MGRLCQFYSYPRNITPIAESRFGVDGDTFFRFACKLTAGEPFPVSLCCHILDTAQ
jgi:hypothetical protein